MTLLLNLIGPRGIHQSSDYRLTDVSTRQAIEDELGSKQVHFLGSKWSAQISFTGFASIGQRKTHDWILEILERSANSDAHAAIIGLAERAAFELRGIAPKDRFLTIVATVLEKGREPRVFVVSCIDRPGKPPLSQPLDHFEVTEVLADSPKELIFGYTKAVSQADRRFLEHLNKGRTDQAEIRRALARVNSRAAKRSNGAISEGCLVSSTMPNGLGASENLGRVPGLPTDFAGSVEMAERIKRAQRTDRPVFIQGRHGSFENTRQATLGPMNVNEGSTLIVQVAGDSPPLFVTDSNGNTFRTGRIHPSAMSTGLDAEWMKLEDGKKAGASHRVEFSSTSYSHVFNGPTGPNLKYGSMEFLGVTGDAVVTKNRVTKIELGSFRIQAYPAFEHLSAALKTGWNIRSRLVLHGAEPHDWGYTVDLVLGPSGASIRIHDNSVAFRSTGVAALSFLEDSEELVLASSTRPFEITISKEQPNASAVVEARLFLRDIVPPE